MRLDRTYHCYHFPAERLAFSMNKCMNSKIKIEPCVYITLCGYHSPAERLSFSTEAMTIIEEVLKTRPTVANISVQYQAGVLHNIVKVRFSAFYSHY